MWEYATQNYIRVCMFSFMIETCENFSFKKTGVSPEVQKFGGDENYFWTVRYVL